MKRLISVLIAGGLLFAESVDAACNGGVPVTSTLIISSSCDGGTTTPLKLETGANVTVNAGVTVYNDAVTGRNGDAITVQSNSTNVSLTNYGTIYTDQQFAIYVNSGAVVDSIINFGTIQSVQRRAVVVNGTINSITNVGLISGPFADLTVGVVMAINNLQGASGGSSTPLLATKNPNSYNVIISSSTTYGKLTVDSVSGTMAFNIYGNSGVPLISGVSASAVAVGTYYGVLSGFTSLSNVTGTSGTYAGLNYSLIADPTTAGQWNLVFTIPAPTVTTISPTSGSTAGGNTITITGTNLTGATGITVGGNACTSINVASATSATCVTPVGTAGTASVLVTTSSGSSTANTLYTYVASAPSPEPIPTLSEWAEIMMMFFMLVTVGWHGRRLKQR